MQKVTVVENLHEEVARDAQHLRHLIGICEGNLDIWHSLSRMKYMHPSFLQCLGSSCCSDNTARFHYFLYLK